MEEVVVLERERKIKHRIELEQGEKEIEIPIFEKIIAKYNVKENKVTLIHRHSLNGETAIEMTLNEFRDFIVKLTRFYAGIKKKYFADTLI